MQKKRPSQKASKNMNQGKRLCKAFILSGICILLSESTSNAMQLLLRRESPFHLSRTLQRESITTTQKRSYSNTLPQQTFDLGGTKYIKDRFGTLYPLWKSLPKEEINPNMTQFVKLAKEQYPGKAIMVPLNTEEFGFTQSFKNAGFEVHSATIEKMELLVKNGSPIPPPSTSSNVSRLILINGNREILLVEDKNHPGALMFPGGYVDQGELSLMAAAREGQEEVGISATPQSIKMVAIMNRVKANPYNASLKCLYYYCEGSFDRQIKIQNEELIRAFWFPLSKLVETNEANGLKPNIVTSEILKYILSESKESTTLFLPDLLRQLRKPENEQDKKDIMTLNLFPVYKPVYKTEIE